jgi:hypothetical protein
MRIVLPVRFMMFFLPGEYWVFAYLFAKKDRDNIADSELIEFRKLAKAYAILTRQQVGRLMQNNSWMEICK